MNLLTLEGENSLQNAILRYLLCRELTAKLLGSCHPKLPHLSTAQPLHLRFPLLLRSAVSHGLLSRKLRETPAPAANSGPDPLDADSLSRALAAAMTVLTKSLCSSLFRPSR